MSSIISASVEIPIDNHLQFHRYDNDMPPPKNPIDYILYELMITLHQAFDIYIQRGNEKQGENKDIWERNMTITCERAFAYSFGVYSDLTTNFLCPGPPGSGDPLKNMIKYVSSIMSIYETNFGIDPNVDETNKINKKLLLKFSQFITMYDFQAKIVAKTDKTYRQSTAEIWKCPNRFDMTSLYKHQNMMPSPEIQINIPLEHKEQIQHNEKIQIQNKDVSVEARYDLI